jgi:phage gp29-like protein
MADQNSNTPSPTTKGLGKEFGQSGTLVMSGIIVNEEYNTKLSNHITANRIYDQMRRSDATVRSTLQVCKLPILSAQWDIEPASDDKQDIYAADFIKFQLFKHNLNWFDFLREGLTFFEFGHAVAEKTFELTEYEGQTRIGINKIGYRKQRSIQAWQTKEGKAGITQQLIGESVSIPMEKLIVFVNDKEGDNLEGISLLRYAFKHWDIKDKLDIINAIALEKLAVGVPVLKKPSDADEGDLAKARAALRNFRANEEGYQEIPTGWDLEMLDMKANSTKDVIPTIQYHDRQIQMSVLAQFLSLGASDASGSRAVSEDHSKLFLLSEEAVAKNIQATVQQQLIKQLCDLNFTDLPNGYPKLTFSKIGDEDAESLAINVKTLMDAGAITYDAELEVYLRKVLRLPDLPDAIKEQFEADLAAQEKARKSGKTIPDTSSKGTKVIDKTGSDLKDEEKNTDPEKQKKAVAASAINEARAAKRKLIDIVLAS